MLIIGVLYTKLLLCQRCPRTRAEDGTNILRRDNQFHPEQLTLIRKFYSIQDVLAYEELIDRAMLQFCEQLEDSFINGDNARKMCNLADWTPYCKPQYPLSPW